MATKVTGPSNIEKRMLARELWKTQKPIWRVVSKKLDGAAKNRVEKNLGAIDRVVSEGDVIVVPGKVLASGDLTKNITIASFSISKSAADKLKQQKIKYMTIPDLVKKNPKGKGVKIIV